MEAKKMGTDHRPGNAVILMYHRIADDCTDLCVSPSEFRDHLAFLSEEGYRVLPLPELALALQRGSVPERSVAITLDDGYLDALTHAAPILQEFQFPATFFVISSTLDGPTEFWWETLERVFAHEGLPVVIDTPLPEGVASMPTQTLQDKREAFDAVRRTFYPLTLEQRRERIGNLLQWSGLPPLSEAPHARALTAEEVRTLGRLPGMEIGAHTENHLLLPTQSTEAKEREIVLGKQRLEALLGYEVQSFSYPHGAFDEESVELTRRAGFTVAVTTGNQPAWPQSHPLVLPRCGVRAGDDLRSRLHALFAAPPETHHYNRRFA
jgi:peptidoglycan/xylan/chitin deacetylase (PgdA/CDA1 family)